jgi:hypothetical protein
MTPVTTCAECKILFKPEDKRQRYCSRRCARIAQARGGIPSHEDRKARLLDGVSKMVDELFGEKK